MGQHSSPKTPATGLLSSQTFTDSGKHVPVPIFWDVLLPSNSKLPYFFLKSVQFLSLNIWYVFYVLFWIKYGFMRFANHFTKRPNFFGIGLVFSLHRCCLVWNNSITFLFQPSVKKNIISIFLNIIRGPSTQSAGTLLFLFRLLLLFSAKWGTGNGEWGAKTGKGRATKLCSYVSMVPHYSGSCNDAYRSDGGAIAQWFTFLVHNS